MRRVIQEGGSLILDTALDSVSVPSEISATLERLRPLGPFEELLWQMDKHSPLHACLVAHVDGRTTIAGWRAALEQTRQRHPLWSAVITQMTEEQPWFRRRMVQDLRFGSSRETSLVARA